MIITFLGHSSLCNFEKLLEKIKETILENLIDGETTLFYCGGYGDFDNLCVQACHSIKKKRANCEIVFVTPYISESQQKKIKHLVASALYDSVLFPPLENIPVKFAISKRNEWMVDKANLIIAYVEHTYGGAYKSLEYARKKKKRIINLADNS